jgi:GntR family transcriptional repressor for pyruvate dehydrogenase complex
MRLYEEVMVNLAELIRKGQFRPGDRLPSERELVKQLRVSRTTLREALRVMQQQGLIMSKRGAGNFIANGSADELALTLNHLALQDIFELRMVLEPSIAALAAQRATPQDLAQLEAILQKQTHQIQKQKNIAETDAAFHAALAEATHNHALQQMGATLMKVLSPSRNESLQTPRRAQLSLTSHRRILDAIKERSSLAARQAMEDHLRSVDAALFGLPAEQFTTIPNLLYHTAASRPSTQRH